MRGLSRRIMEHAESLSEADRDELAAARTVMPIWMADPVSTRLAHA